VTIGLVGVSDGKAGAGARYNDEGVSDVKWCTVVGGVVCHEYIAAALNESFPERDFGVLDSTGSRRGDTIGLVRGS